MPDVIFATRDSIPEGLGEHVKEVDGKFVVNVVPATKVDEFRNNNIAVSKERDTLKGTLEKLTPVVGDDLEAFLAEIGELRSLSTQVKDGKLKASGDIQAEVDRRVATMKEGLERQNGELATQVAHWKTAAQNENHKFRRSIIDRAITDAVLATDSGANPDALGDFLQRAYGVFQVTEDNKLVAKDGDAIIYGGDGATPMSPKEWMAKVRQTSSYLFKNSSGGGSTGGNNGGRGYTGNMLPGGMNVEDFKKMPASQRIAYARKHGITKVP